MRAHTQGLVVQPGAAAEYGLGLRPKPLLGRRASATPVLAQSEQCWVGRAGFNRNKGSRPGAQNGHTQAKFTTDLKHKGTKTVKGQLHCS